MEFVGLSVPEKPFYNAPAKIPVSTCFDVMKEK